MQIEATAIADVRLVTPRRFADRRGHFAETWNRQKFAEAGIASDFCQDNLSFSRPVGTVRGLHFQTPPFAQDKLVAVLAGRILDVAVDLRRGSPSYGRHVAVELSAEAGAQLFIPQGFAHGFCTLEPDTTVFYKVSAPYAPAHDTGLRWNDPALAIDWPVTEAQAVLSDKDRSLPGFGDFQTPFGYGKQG
jgi:dTDP-4-dehydrorhamnose 3,5-epimerase